MPAKIRRALVSVSNKDGLVDFARSLAFHHVDILSTGGSAALLRSNNLKVTEVSEFTGFPEILDGRVKTLHPRVFGGILGRRDLDSHRDQMREHKIEPIDLIVVNLYPFRETVAKLETSEPETMQTGPAIRGDEATIQRHLELLKSNATFREVYRMLTCSIQAFAD